MRNGLLPACHASGQQLPVPSGYQQSTIVHSVARNYVRSPTPQLQNYHVTSSTFVQSAPYTSLHVPVIKKAPTPVMYVSAFSPTLCSRTTSTNVALKVVPQGRIAASAVTCRFGPQVAKSVPTSNDSGLDSSDSDLKKLKDLCTCSGLKNVPVSEGLNALMRAADGNQLTRQQFLRCYASLLQSQGIKVPSETVRSSVFDLFDGDRNGVVDLMEIISGVSLMCSGSHDEKLAAVFSAFDTNSDGFISKDEMFTFLTSVFRVGLTPQLLSVINDMGTTVMSPEELASITALECFQTADLNEDGKLSIDEFKCWFHAPEHDPSMFFSPLRDKK
eukprot:TRINITY_DN21628_c0_g1_i2.p1 TRINITY_DN21628_c0_g1~~TRINITY_DN21628_c0_g1_i2.p1  ORF type:complete len:331 (+),score=30.77 TRINITY_DN21628_c0_g1_i2:102-1094(+)